MGFFPIPTGGGCCGGAFPPNSRIYARKETNQGIISGDDILFDQLAGSLASPSAGVYTLLAGVTYELEASLGIEFDDSPNGFAEYEWVDSGGTPVGLANKGSSYSASNTTEVGEQTIAMAIVSPLANMDVKLRITSMDDDGGTMLADFSFASIKALS